MTDLPPRFVLALLAATALTGCASPQFPIQLAGAAPPPAQRVVATTPAAAAQAAPAAALEEDPASAPLATAPVEIRALEPPPAAARAAEEPRAEAPPPAAAPVQLAALTPRYPTRAPVAEPAPEPRLILAATRKSSRAAGADDDGPAATYTVRKGDTLGAIADRLGVGLTQLKAANGLKRNAIHPGQVLKNPKARTASAKTSRSRADRAEAAPEAAETYKVRRGDTLFAISRRFNVTEAELRAANGLGKKASLKAGQTLKIRGAADEAPIETAGADETVRSMASDRSAAGRVVDVAGSARTHRVRKGDNLSVVADKLDMSIEQVAKLNKLKKPYRLQPGQVIRGKAASSAKAYVVASGDTLSEIARRFDVTEQQLRAANGLKRGARVAPGRKLRLPPGFRDRGPVMMASRNPLEEPQRPGAALPGGPQPYVPPRVPPRQYTPPPVTPGGSGSLFGAPTPTPTPSDTQLSQMGRGVFIWPMRGEMLSTFGPKAGGVGNDGLNIRAASGDSVRAAAAGDVIYAGDQVPGYGNLVLIRHSDGWVTAYGHLSKVDVRMQQKVIQGQQIGQAGQTGGVGETQLHFEVRYQPNAQERAKPIDPQLVLPR